MAQRFSRRLFFLSPVPIFAAREPRATEVPLTIGAISVFLNPSVETYVFFSAPQKAHREIALFNFGGIDDTH